MEAYTVGLEEKSDCLRRREFILFMKKGCFYKRKFIVKLRTVW